MSENRPDDGEWCTVMPVKAEHEEGAEPSWIGMGYAETGAPFVRVLFEIAEGDYQGQRYLWRSYSIGAGIEVTAKALRALGVPNDDIMACDDPGFEGLRTVRGLFKHEYGDDGTLYVRLSFLGENRQMTKIAKPMNAGSKQQFAARMKASMAALGAPPPPAATKPAPAGAGYSSNKKDDDIPF